ncbi:MAG TPA: transposase [Chthoniobacterales bacterium]|nr:transposase [Chthoniobacterales bacterium]
MNRFLRKPLDHSVHFAGRFGATYFITMCCEPKGRNQLCKKQIAEQIFGTATLYDHRGRWHLELMLLMPDHLHALVAIDDETSLSTTISSFKRAMSKSAGIRWQGNFFDHRLRNDESLDEKATYIMNNPVRAGLVQNQRDWSYLLD